MLWTAGPRHAEVALDIGLRRRIAVHLGVVVDEGQVLPLPPCERDGLRPAADLEGGQPGQVLIDGIQSEVTGIETTADPLDICGVLRVILVQVGLQELHVPPDPAHILRGTGSLAFQAAGTGDAGLRLPYLFHLHLVLPAVTKVVFVDQCVAGIRSDLLQGELLLIQHLRTPSLQLGVELAILGAAHVKGVEMRVGPSHGDLDHGMELAEGTPAVHRNTPPYGRLAFRKGDPQLVDHVSLDRSPAPPGAPTGPINDGKSKSSGKQGRGAPAGALAGSSRPSASPTLPQGLRRGH